ncbi:hypothetical protein [Nocardia fusca]|uniref:Uncharacterized protein n=1 Tax=Nocardia fusca TaxID=941183 RepID=A0ABV3FAB8_9NOCA
MSSHQGTRLGDAGSFSVDGAWWLRPAAYSRTWVPPSAVLEPLALAFQSG